MYDVGNRKTLTTYLGGLKEFLKLSYVIHLEMEGDDNAVNEI